MSVDDLLDLLGGKLARLDVEAQARHRGRRERRGSGPARDLLSPAVEELQEETGPLGMSRLAHACKTWNDRFVEAG
jgi:hypothetical protein